MLCFVVPAHGRLPLARITLRRLAAVCEETGSEAVVVACDENLDVAHRLGMHTIHRDNRTLGARFNDGFAYAASRAEYVMPIGNDDLITPTLVQSMLALAGDPDVMVSTRYMSALSHDGELARLKIPYEGGPGTRLISSVMLHRCAYRPADEHRQRALDTSIQRNLRAAGPLRFAYADGGPLDLIDVKTAGANLNTYEMLLPYALSRTRDPWPLIAEAHGEEVAEGLRLLC